MGLHQTKQIEIGVLTRANRPKYGYCPDRLDRKMDSNLTEHRYCPDQTERNMDFDQVD